MARASVKRRTDRPSDKPWLVRWREPDGRQRKESYARKVDAERRATELEGQMAQGDYVDPSAGRQAIGAYGTAWLERQGHLKPKAASSQRSLWRSRVEPRWAKVALADVRYSDVKGWVATMSRELSASRTRQAYHVLTALLDEAVKDRLIPRNPAAGVQLPKIKPSERWYLDHHEVTALANEAGPDGALVYTLAYCGLRWGEATAMRVRDVNPLKHRMTIVRAVADVDGILVEQDAKNHERREIPVPAFLVEMLEERISGSGRDELVFPNSRGGWMRNQNARRDWWNAACRRAGLEGLTPHELRHTAASLAVAAGANVLAVARMLGHADPSVTLRIYADLFDDHLDDVAERMDAARLAPRTRPRMTKPASAVAETGS